MLDQLFALGSPADTEGKSQFDFQIYIWILKKRLVNLHEVVERFVRGHQ
jgi:hypothetical protein